METWEQQSKQLGILDISFVELAFESFLKRNILPNFGGSVVNAVVTENGSVFGRVVELEFSTRGDKNQKTDVHTVLNINGTKQTRVTKIS